MVSNRLPLRGWSTGDSELVPLFRCCEQEFKKRFLKTYTFKQLWKVLGDVCHEWRNFYVYIAKHFHSTRAMESPKGRNEWKKNTRKERKKRKLSLNKQTSSWTMLEQVFPEYERRVYYIIVAGREWPFIRLKKHHLIRTLKWLHLIAHTCQKDNSGHVWTWNRSSMQLY